MKRALRRAAVRSVSAALRFSGAGQLIHSRRRRRGDFRAFILEYHGVDPENREWEGTISQRRFRAHLQRLTRRFRLCTVSEAVDRLTEGELDRDLCVITFDDGYLNNVEGAWPVLQEFGVPATIYLTTGFLDGEPLWFDVARRALAAAQRPGACDATAPSVAQELTRALGAWPPLGSVDATMRKLKALPGARRLEVVHRLRSAGLALGSPARAMTWDQARRLQANGVELGAHTVTHPILSRLDAEAQEREILGSVQRLTEELKQPPETFAMPNGSAADYDRHTLSILRRSGLKGACTTRRGSCAAASDPFELPRLGIGSDSPSVLDARLAGAFDADIRRRLHL